MRIVSDGKSIVVPSCGAMDIYSTEEQVVGRWIDGKPLYRKVVVNIPPVSVDNKEIEIYAFESAVDAVSRCDLYIAAMSVPRTYKVPEQCYRLCWTHDALFVSKSSSTGTKGLGTLIIEYTKISDGQSAIELPAALNVSAPAYAAAPQSVESAVLDAGVETEEV